ncbi:MAG: hypothetical protein KDI09_06330, partial [Halioglobus sp.]|nr:hypothetical protein [Halioglobus sp.]
MRRRTHSSSSPVMLLVLVAALLLQGCRITQIVPEGGAVVSASGQHACAAGATCVIELHGEDFSDTFTAVPAPGYRFMGWQQSPGSLCAGKTTPCALVDVPGSLTALEADTFLLPVFAPDDTPVSINSTSASGLYPFAYSPVTERPRVSGGDYAVFGVNDLGMHCVDLDGRIANILPPFQVLLGQVVLRGQRPVLNPPGIELAYSAASNPHDPILLKPAARRGIAPDGTLFKSNFWQGIVQGSYDAFYPPLVTPLSQPPFAVTEDLGLPVPDAEQLYLGGNGVVGDGDESLTAQQQAMPGVGAPLVANTPQVIHDHYDNKP